MVAEALPTAGAAATPAKKRQTSNDVTPGDKPAPRVKSAKTGVVTRMTLLRPAVSLSGAPMRGPAA